MNVHMYVWYVSAPRRVGESEIRHEHGEEENNSSLSRNRKPFAFSQLIHGPVDIQTYVAGRARAHTHKFR